MAEENTASLIIDTGSWLTKAGLSHDDYPRVVTPSVSGRDAHTDLVYYGKEALDRQSELAIEPLVSVGAPRDWAALESFWHFLCTKELELDLPDKSVLTSHYASASKLVKERSVQLFFESFNVPFYYTASSALLTLYSSGRVNGLVVDSGDQVTSVVPIYEGCAMPFGQVSAATGGADLTAYLARELRVDDATARDIKEKYCRVSLDYEREAAEQRGEGQPEKLVLPDGAEVDAREWNIRVPEGIFSPELLGHNRPGLHALIVDALAKTDPDYRREFMANVIVSGGNTNFATAHERLQRELGGVLPSFLKVKCYNLPDKTNSVWFGGAIVSSLGTFQPLLISRSEYDEIGPSIVNRKCL